jgi:hypothetical protein
LGGTHSQALWRAHLLGLLRPPNRTRGSNSLKYQLFRVTTELALDLSLLTSVSVSANVPWALRPALVGFPLEGGGRFGRDSGLLRAEAALGRDSLGTAHTNYSKAPGTGAHDVGCHGNMRSHSFGSVARPITQALIERDHETVARKSSLRTSIGVPSRGAVSIGSHSEDDSVTEVIACSAPRAGLLTSNCPRGCISEPQNCPPALDVPKRGSPAIKPGFEVELSRS